MTAIVIVAYGVVTAVAFRLPPSELEREVLTSSTGSSERRQPLAIPWFSWDARG